MNSQDEYIVFLKDLKIPEGYKSNNKEENSFMFTNPQLSIFNYSRENTTLLIDDETKNSRGFTYNIIMDYDLIFMFKEDKQLYDNIREQVMSKYRSL